MATELYFTSYANVHAQALDAAWGTSANRVTRHMDHVRRNSPMTTVSIVETSGSAINVCAIQGISRPLDGDQTIAGDFKMLMRALETATDADARAQLVLRVLSPDGAVRGTLIAADASALSSEFPITTAANRKFPLAATWGGGGYALSSVDGLDGDFVVLEAGARFHNAIAGSRGATFHYGDTVATLLAEDETGTTNDTPYAWFSQTINFRDYDRGVARAYSFPGGSYTSTPVGGLYLPAGSAGIANLARDHTAPRVDSYDPNDGETIAATDPIAFRVFDALDALGRVTVYAQFSGGGGPPEVVHDGDAFKGRYASLSVRDVTSGGWEYSIAREGGWPGTGLEIVVTTHDADGNEMDPTTITYTVSDPVDADTPTLTGASPANLSTIDATDEVAFAIEDATGLKTVVIHALQGELDETVYDSANGGFGPAYTGSATPAPPWDESDTSVAFEFTRTEGYTDADTEIVVTATDQTGHSAALGLEYTVSNPTSTGGIPPVVDNFSPADDSTVAASDAFGFDVTAEAAIASVMVIVQNGSDAPVVAYNGAFRGQFAASSARSDIAGGYHFEIDPGAAKWPKGTIALTVIAVDETGAAVVHTTYGLTVSNPVNVTAPDVGNYVPPRRTRLQPNQPIQFDVTDDSGQFLRVRVDLYYPNTGLTETVYNGFSFLGLYAGPSRATAIAGGVRFIIARTGGWPSKPSVIVDPIDIYGNAG